MAARFLSDLCSWELGRTDHRGERNGHTRWHSGAAKRPGCAGSVAASAETKAQVRKVTGVVIIEVWRDGVRAPVKVDVVWVVEGVAQKL